MKHQWEILWHLDGGSVPHEYCNISPKYPKASTTETLYQVRCKHCGSSVFTIASRIDDQTIHRDWFMEEDCNSKCFQNGTIVKSENLKWLSSAHLQLRDPM